MTDPKDNYIPAEVHVRRDGSSLCPSRPAGEGDEDVLASIARRHASRLGLRQGDFSAEATSVASETGPPAASPVESPAVSEVESPVCKPIDLCSAGPGDAFYVRQAMRKSPPESASSKSVRRLIIHLTVVAVLTGLAVATYFLMR